MGIADEGRDLSGFFDYWGKAPSESAEYHLLAFHSLDVAAVGAELLGRDPLLVERAALLSPFTVESLRRVLPYLLALHDLGKFSETFQDYRPDLVTQLQGERPARGSRVRHDTLGYLLWRAWTSPKPLAEEATLAAGLVPVAMPTGPACRRDLDEITQSWMAAVLGHHGKPPENAQLPGPVFGARPLARSRKDAASFAKAARELLVPGDLVCTTDDVDALICDAKRSSWWVAGFAILCDWLGSDERHFPFAAGGMALDEYWPQACDRAARAVAESGLARSRPRPFCGIGDLFPGIAAAPTPLQVAVAETRLDAGPNLFILEDLTGSGKTEAALVLAHRLMAAGRGDGIYFALPTMATANAMHGRVRPLLEKLFEGRPSYLLSHSGPRLEEQDRLAIAQAAFEASRPGAYGPDEQPTASAAASAWLADGRKRALLAELGVGTIDQAMLAALQSKHAAMRLFGLHRHVLVVDEVHACDAYMLQVLSELLTIHAAMGGSAILLSATLPRGQRQRLVRAFGAGVGSGAHRGPGSMDYPLLTRAGSGETLERKVEPRSGTERTIPVTWHHGSEAAVERVVQAARAGLCACWVRNSVKDALDGYRQVAALLGQEQVTLFHARYALGDRLAIEQRVLGWFGADGKADDRLGRVVVATQVVEQSLDIDFDVMVTDLCPIDLIVQRAGRLQRHSARDAGRPSAVLEVLAPVWRDDPPADWLGGPFRRTAFVYPDPGVLWRTQRELRRRGALVLPGAARDLLEAVFGDEDVPEALGPRSNEALGADMAHASVAQNAVLKLSQGYLREGADWSDDQRTPTRLGEPTTTVRLAAVGPTGAEPWFARASGRHRWPLSQVSVARRLVAKPAPGDEDIRTALEATQPFAGDDVVTVLLREEAPGRWRGSAVAERRRGRAVEEVPVAVGYSRELGLQVE